MTYAEAQSWYADMRCALYAVPGIDELNFEPFPASEAVEVAEQIIAAEWEKEEEQAHPMGKGISLGSTYDQ